GRAVTPHPRGGAPLPPPHSPPTYPPTSAHPLLRSRPDQRAGRARVCPPAGPSAGSRRDYNEGRPHISLGYQTPAESAARCRASSPDSAFGGRVGSCFQLDSANQAVALLRGVGRDPAVSAFNQPAGGLPV